MTGYIYMHTSPSGLSYIGKSLVAKVVRWDQHVLTTYDEKYKEYDYPLQRAIRKYGENSFVSEILEDGIPEELLPELEVLYIEKYNTFYNGYNQTKGGEGTSGERSEEAKENIARANRERIWTQDMKDKMSNSKSGINGSRFVPWFILTPNGILLEFYDIDKASYALSQNWHVGSFKNMFSKDKKVGSKVMSGKFKGYTFGNIGVKYGE